MMRMCIGLVLIGFAYTIAWGADAVTPCTNLLAVVNRPNNADSPCSIAKGHIEIEAGFQYQRLSLGTQQNAPATELRLGLPFDNELFFLLPNYIHQNVSPRSGFTQTIAGIKHEVAYSSDWIVSVEGIINMPDGSYSFGDRQLGSAFNGIFSYSLTPKWGITWMLGGSSMTEARQLGGRRFESINPYVVLSYAPIEKINIYGEIYGQSKTAPMEGGGINVDAGLLYLMRTNWVVDISIGQQITGSLGGFKQYIGAGFSLMLW